MTLKNRYLLYKVRTFIDDFEEDENMVRDWTLCYDRKQDKIIAIKTTPVKKFIKEPATRIISRFHQAAFWKEWGSSVSSFSPSIAQ